MPTNVPCVHSWSHDTHRGGSPVPATLWSACPSVMVLHFFLYEGTPLSETAYTSVKCYWEMKGSVLNCHRNVRWTETTDSCFTNCSTQNAFCSGVAIIAVLRHRPREKRGVGLRMSRKTWRPAVSFHVGTLLLHAFSKPGWQIESAPIILIHSVQLGKTTTKMHRSTSTKSEDLSCTESEVWNVVFFKIIIAWKWEQWIVIELCVYSLCLEGDMKRRLEKESAFHLHVYKYHS